MRSEPRFWMHETSGVLRPAVVAYLSGGEMSDEHVAAMRAYLRQWIAGPFTGDVADQLRTDIDGLTTRAAIAKWLRRAVAAGIDPL